MAKLVYGLNQSLDGYVDHTAFGPGPALFRHFIERLRGTAALLHGRRLYEIMSYWDEDQPGWDDPEREFAAVWRTKPKWVASNTLTSVGPNATLIEGGLEAAARDLKARIDGDIEVGGTVLAAGLTDLGFIDEYHIYLHPVVTGGGTPYFAAARPRLRLLASDNIDGDVIRLTYVPA